MASPSNEERIIRELTRRGTCSFLDLKSALRLSRGDIIGITARLANRRFVRIEKDQHGEPINFIWTGPKEKAPGGKRSPVKKSPPSSHSSASHARVTAIGVVSPTASSVKKSSPKKSYEGKPHSPALEPVPADWKQRLEKFALDISSRPDWKQRHSKEQEIMLQLLRKKEIEEAANITWEASRKVNPKWDASVFYEHFLHVIYRLAIYACIPRLTVKDLRIRAEDLETMRDRELISRQGSDREKLDREISILREILDREISILRRQAENTSKTKPEFPGPRLALQFLRQYFQYHLKKPLNQAIGLLMRATFRRKWSESTVRVRAAELASAGLMKATADNTTKEKFAALDKLEGEKLEAEFEKMSPRLRDLYLRSGMD